MKTVITCAITGGTAVPRNHPNFPITPVQIATQALDAARAGAGIVHLHVRNPDTGAPTGDIVQYRETVDRIRQANPDLVINLTTGWGCVYVPRPGEPGIAGEGTNMLPALERVAHVAELRPEICTLDMHTLQIPDVVGGKRGSTIVIMNLDPILAEMAEMIRDAGVKPEIEIFDAGDLGRSARLIKSGALDGPGLYTFVLSATYGLPPTPEAMMLARNAMPPGAVWTGMGVGAASFPMAAQSVLLGGHVRVGLEDNLYMSRGKYAESNAALVAQARRIVESLGAEVASPAEARSLIGLTPRQPVHA